MEVEASQFGKHFDRIIHKPIASTIVDRKVDVNTVMLNNKSPNEKYEILFAFRNRLNIFSHSLTDFCFDCFIE